MVDYNQFFQNPLTILGAGMMQGADPRGEGLGGLGFGLLNTANIMREQEALGAEQERARQLADLQIQTFRAKQAQVERAMQQQERFETMPGLDETQRALIQAGYGQDVAKQLTTPEKLSAAARMYNEAGGQAGTGMTLFEFMQSPAAPGTKISVGGVSKPPDIPGFATIQDPREPTGYRYVRVGGGPEKAATPEKREAAKMDKTAQEALASLDRLEELVNQYGAEPLPGGGRPSMESAVRRAALTMKNVAEMGALQGREEQMLYELIGDPTEAFSSLKGKESYLQKLKEARKFVEDKRRIFGRQEDTTPPPPPGFVRE